MPTIVKRVSARKKSSDGDALGLKVRTTRPTAMAKNHVLRSIMTSPDAIRKTLPYAAATGSGPGFSTPF